MNNHPAPKTSPRSRTATYLSDDRRPALIGAGLVLIALAGYFAFDGQSDGHKAANARPAAPVVVAEVKTQDVPVYAQAIGTVVANATVQIKSRIDGEITSTDFKEGQIVHKGDLLFEIDPAPYEAALRAAKANLQRDDAQLANAKTELARAQNLARNGSVSTQVRDTAIATKQSLTATVAADQAAVDQAQLQLDYTKIRSPIDGKTGPILVDAGNIIKANDANPLVVVTQIQPIKISFALAQQNLPQLQAQMHNKTLVAVLTPHRADNAPTSSAKPITVPVDFIGNSVDTASGTIELRATYDNADFRLVPGEFVDLQVRLDELKNVTTLPRDAVNTGQDGLYVFVVGKDNKVAMRKVTLLYGDDNIAAVAGDVKANERVVTDGQMRLTPGATVQIVDGGKEAASS